MVRRVKVVAREYADWPSVTLTDEQVAQPKGDEEAMGLRRKVVRGAGAI